MKRAITMFLSKREMIIHGELHVTRKNCKITT